MLSELEPNQQMVEPCRRILASVGAPLSRLSRILDFGCGIGRHVAEFRRAGYMAEGVDQPVRAQVESLGVVDPDLRPHLHLSESDTGRFPFADDSFDFCYSTSVLEHVVDSRSAFQEIARVLRPGGHTLHVFPARWRPIEPHIFVPFGGRFMGRRWQWIWAHAGIANVHQRGLTRAQVLDSNQTYSKLGLSYPTTRQIRRNAADFFGSVRWMEPAFIDATRDQSRASRLAAPAVRVLPALGVLYRGFHTRVLLAQKR